MRVFRFALLSLSCICLAGWWILHRPYSPSQDLTPVSLTAFEIGAPSVEAGNALARAAAHWNGVTAVAYNPQSDLLAVSHTLHTPAAELQRRLQILVPHQISIKTFPEPAGPKCPVPQAAITVLPQGLLIAGLVAGLLALWLFFKGIVLNRPFSKPLFTS